MGVMNVRDHGGAQGDVSGENRLEPDSFAISANVPQQVHVEIDELVLTGFPRSQGSGIAEAIRETLSRLLAGEQMPWRSSEGTQVDRLDAGTVHLSRSGRARSAGEQVARAIYRSLPK